MNNLIDLHSYLEDWFAGLEAVPGHKCRWTLCPQSNPQWRFACITKDVHYLVPLTPLQQSKDQGWESFESKTCSELHGILKDNLPAVQPGSSRAGLLLFLKLTQFLAKLENKISSFLFLVTFLLLEQCRVVSDNHVHMRNAVHAKTPSPKGNYLRFL